MSKQMKQLTEAMEQDIIINLLDEVYEQERKELDMAREYQEYGYINNSIQTLKSINVYNAIEYGCFA